MVFFNYALRKLNTKIVYYGPGLCGKTTNLQWIHDHFEGGEKGKMVSLATEGDRTIFFDLLPLEIGTIRGMDVTLQLYTVPGQVHYNATRQLVLRGADGVVFVADSQQTMKNSNIESLQNLRENLSLQGVDLETFPHVLQFNKRDLRNIMPIEEMDRDLNEYSVPIFEGVAVEGIGVEDTLGGIVKLVMRSLRDRYENQGERAAFPAPTSPEAAPGGGPATPMVFQAPRPMAPPTWGAPQTPSPPAAAEPEAPSVPPPEPDLPIEVEPPDQHDDLLETKPTSAEEALAFSDEATGVYQYAEPSDDSGPGEIFPEEQTDPKIEIAGIDSAVPEIEVDLSSGDGGEEADTQTGILFPEEMDAASPLDDESAENIPVVAEEDAEEIDLLSEEEELEEAEFSPEEEERSDPYADTIPPDSGALEELLHHEAVSSDVDDLVGAALREELPLQSRPVEVQETSAEPETDPERSFHQHVSEPEDESGYPGVVDSSGEVPDAEIEEAAPDGSSFGPEDHEEPMVEFTVSETEESEDGFDISVDGEEAEEEFAAPAFEEEIEAEDRDEHAGVVEEFPAPETDTGDDAIDEISQDVSDRAASPVEEAFEDEAFASTPEESVPTPSGSGQEFPLPEVPVAEEPNLEEPEVVEAQGEGPFEAFRETPAEFEEAPDDDEEEIFPTETTDLGSLDEIREPDPFDVTRSEPPEVFDTTETSSEMTEPVFFEQGDPFEIPSEPVPAEILPAEVSKPELKISGGENSLAVKLTGTGAIVESGEVRALDIEVPVPGSWIGNRRVTLQLRLTLSPATEEADGE